MEFGVQINGPLKQLILQIFTTTVVNVVLKKAVVLFKKPNEETMQTTSNAKQDTQIQVLHL